MSFIPQPVKTWSAADCAVVFGGFKLTGFADGDFVTVEYSGDAFTMKEGADGIVTRSKKNLSRAGSITVRCQQRSMANNILNTFFRTGVVVPFTLKDTINGEMVNAPQAWIAKPPSLPFGKESTDREWRIDSNDIDWYAPPI